jgi:MYXO-CTERM domain-containing protein
LGAEDSASGSGNPALPPSAESADGDATSSAGCSVGHASRTGSTLAVLGMLGLFGALRRRRAR